VYFVPRAALFSLGVTFHECPLKVPLRPLQVPPHTSASLTHLYQPQAIRPMGAQILMGKNTLMKRCIRLYCENKKDDSWACLVPELVGNIGLMFVKDDFEAIKDKIEEFRRPAAAKSGALAQCDVRIDAGPTALDPSQTSFFQALGISTKIQKGTIEILSSVQLITQGERVQASAAALLGKLGIKPFAYGIEVTKVYDGGNFFAAAVLDISDDDLQACISNAIANIACVCLAADYPTLASVPHSIINAYKNNILALGVMLEEYTFPLADKAKEILANPEAFAAAAASAAGAASAAPAVEEKAAVAEESEEEDMGFDLFD
jgi:large subunit ribosomal protein LP0